MSHNFRTALGGFHKEDVVRYLEYINAKHQNQVNQLHTELSELHARLEEAAPVSQDPELAARCQTLEAENQALRERIAALENSCTELSLRQEQTASSGTQELEAYRQAERIQKEARDRSELLYFQANHILTEATAKVEHAAADITGLTDQTMRQLTQLQVAVSAGKQTLQEAAAILATIRPNR